MMVLYLQYSYILLKPGTQPNITLKY